MFEGSLLKPHLLACHHAFSFARTGLLKMYSTVSPFAFIARTNPGPEHCLKYELNMLHFLKLVCVSNAAMP